MDHGLRRRLADRFSAEEGAGTRISDAPLDIALVYPSPYHTAMSSLGYLEIHRRINRRPGARAERAMLPDPQEIRIHRRTRTPLLTVETQRAVNDFSVVAFSLAYELEMTGLVQCLELSGLSPFARDRSALDPLVVLGGPITFSNPLPAAPFCDVVIVGEGEGPIDALLRRLAKDPSSARGSSSARQQLLEELAGTSGFYVPTIHGEVISPLARADDAELPARSEIRTRNTELANMQLIEIERGCHRGCTFCVMRRTTNGGMRLVTPQHIFDGIDDQARRVGLVGAAVSDHPKFKLILQKLVDEQGRSIGVSSLRADRLDADIIGLLRRGGYRSITVALDAPSERARKAVEKNIHEDDIVRVAELAKAEGMQHLKVYVIVGLPDEEPSELTELAEFALRLSRILPIKLGVSPFVPKFRTPLALEPFAGEAVVDAKLKELRRRLGGRVEVRTQSAREAYVEYRLAQGGHAHAAAVVAAVHDGASLSAWRRALLDLPERVMPMNAPDLVPLSTRARIAARSQEDPPPHMRSCC